MKNITLAIDDNVLENARIYAEKNGTTVNAMVREHLAGIVHQAERREAARKGLLELIDKSTARLGPGYKWNREEIYEDRVFSGHQHPDVRSGRKKG